MIQRKDAAWKRAAREFADLTTQVVPLAANLKLARDKLIKLAGEESAQGCGVEAKRKRRVGSVKYADIPELQDLDLNPYRGKDTYYFEVGLV